MLRIVAEELETLSTTISVGVIHCATAGAIADLAHIVVIGHVARGTFAEVTQVVNELYHNISAYGTVDYVARISGAGRSVECAVLAEQVVYADKHLATSILEELFAEIEVAECVLLVVVVRETDVLVVFGVGCESETCSENPF